MKIKNTLAFTALTFAMTFSALPLSAGGSKDKEEASVGNPKNTLHVVDSPIGFPPSFGEGGGPGIIPKEFEEIDDSIIDGPSRKGSMVAAEIVTMTGTVNVKGSAGSRKFTFKCDDGKTYQLRVPEESAEQVAKFKGKKATVDGVFYGSDFLIFDFKVE